MKEHFTAFKASVIIFEMKESKNDAPAHAVLHRP